ncbi:3-oxoacyl-[acyl-carrier-protein] reductase [Streptococcus azizii]|uniref:3-oxoacyl-[acyl-carrier-protein] reductase n=1 Tax=Streptococcus azizii TaxID=1579424 RepID=A0AB36JTR0_9STRE|nr:MULTISPECIES: 3-oxoacyl-[acyl-carrier-protein] reductase [Streptococcus]MBF0776263.1 3-oxoacyl-[acyl-carrier-protein] reductase [Streptococcus sp. 19428wD3_AN2]ONK28119.1 3-oxoacyl-[acyl-carrier-protein] reductase [Streptococcus azizii]ONK30517.1 3-oxoacyl-[acyl-carrier-protein] reductase [Streptococcus azizii]ONK31004.1 3-oxoacyl-[acyl-carrier-protein] reductase [Streptococcus azizii]TFU83391.1 3-oxoacyl-[acyl-carrier-protein] reductase [Streptococcus sp. AN2]
MEISGKNVLITGSSRGIGLGIAHAFAGQGANVILNGRSSIPAEVLESFADYGVKVHVVLGDVAKQQDARQMVAKAIELAGSIDILVNNAGITKDGLALRMSEDDFEAVLKVNLTGTFNMTQAVLKPMTKAKMGAVINVSSVVGLIGNAGQANYAASKAGVIGFTKAIAREVAGRNVRVNAIAPGFIESDMTAVLSDKIREAMLGQIPMKRFGLAQEVADVAVFLARQEYLTGQVIAIDGGLTMQ